MRFFEGVEHCGRGLSDRIAPMAPARRFKATVGNQPEALALATAPYIKSSRNCAKTACRFDGAQVCSKARRNRSEILFPKEWHHDSLSFLVGKFLYSREGGGQRSSRKQPAKVTPRSFRPELQVLEDRIVPAAIPITIASRVVNGDLFNVTSSITAAVETSNSVQITTASAAYGLHVGGPLTSPA